MADRKRLGGELQEVQLGLSWAGQGRSKRVQEVRHNVSLQAERQSRKCEVVYVKHVVEIIFYKVRRISIR
jgi:hypothetical protein